MPACCSATRCAAVNVTAIAATPNPNEETKTAGKTWVAKDELTVEVDSQCIPPAAIIKSGPATALT
jgi:hypothetical protein